MPGDYGSMNGGDEPGQVHPPGMFLEMGMIRAFLLTMALAVTAPAMAQGTGNEVQPASPANAVASIVNSEFPAYDANHDGQLDKAEFSRWMVALKDQEMKVTGKTLAPAEVTAWANGAFATADTDKSSSISKPELIGYLSGGAA